ERGEDVAACAYPCPSYVYSTSEYRFMFLCYVIPALFALPAWLYIFYDSATRMRHHIKLPCRNRDPNAENSASSAKKPVTQEFYYGFFGSALSLIYFLFGPFTATVAGVGFQMGCPVDLDGFLLEMITDGYTESAGCKLNRYSIFVLQFLINI